MPSHPLLNPLPSTPPPTKSERRRQAKHERKVAGTVVESIERLHEQCFTIVYTNGFWLKQVQGIGWVGGYGMFVDSHISMSAYLPSGQTNNTAELTAVRHCSSSPEGRLPFVRIPTMFFWEQQEQQEGGKYRDGLDPRAQFPMNIYGKLCHAGWSAPTV